jgi:hypothetical protein
MSMTTTVDVAWSPDASLRRMGLSPFAERWRADAIGKAGIGISAFSSLTFPITDPALATAVGAAGTALPPKRLFPRPLKTGRFAGCSCVFERAGHAYSPVSAV